MTECTLCPHAGLLRCSHYGGRVVALYEMILSGEPIGVWHLCEPPCCPPTPQDSFFADYADAVAAYEDAARDLREVAS